MAQASAAPGRPQRPAGAPRFWVGPLVIGLCFSLGFGVSKRLLEWNATPWIDLGHGFEVQPLPGTSLESLRMRYGAQGESLRGNPDPPPETTEKPAVQPPAAIEPAPAPDFSADPTEPAGSAEGQPSRPGESDPAERSAPVLEAPPAPALPDATPAR